MAENLLIPFRYIESGRIYFYQDNRSVYFIKCLSCCIDFESWQYFLNHLAINHKEFKQSSLLTEGTQTECNDDGQSSDEIEELDESKTNVDFSEDDEYCLQENQESTNSAEVFYNEHDFIDEELLVIKEEVEVEMLYMQSFNGNNDGVKFCDPIDKDKEVEEGLGPTEDEENTEMNKSNETEIAALLAADDDNDNYDEPPKAEKLTIRAFYNMSRTAPAIMEHFIDLIKQNECQYQSNHRDYSDKKVRQENAKIIGEELNNTWPQLSPIGAASARHSILQLRRWFELEYVRHMKVNNYVSAHEDYYQRLLEFLPFEHLRSLVCDECERRFRTESCLLQHKHRVHNGPLPFECQYCGRNFAHKSTMLTHENRHTMQNSWLCQQCGYSTGTRSDFRQHLATHSDQRRFVCKVCGNSYKQSTSLAVHLRTHQPPTLQCEYCQKMFYENYRLKQHINQKHPNGLVIRHTCSVCECEFDTATALKVHKKVHKKVSKRKRSDDDYDEELEVAMTNCVNVRFDCRFCGDNFPNEHNLLEHMLAMHGE